LTVRLVTVCTTSTFLHQWVDSVMVCARSHSFQRTIKDGSDRVSNDGRLTIVQCHHYHRPPSLDLYQTSVGILPYSTTTNKPAFLSLPLPSSTMYHLPQHNQSPTMLHTCSMSQANHIAHAPVLEVMGFSRHKDLRGFESASFIISLNVPFYNHMLS